MKKILTIVIPTYNMQDYLRRCLDSLIVPEKQMKQLEVLVINDGSKDNSSAIAHEYQDKYPDTFRVIDKENGNYGSCINRGLKEASGKYIKILDADDKFNSINFPGYIDFLLNNDSDMVLTVTDVVVEEKIINRWAFIVPEKKEIDFISYNIFPEMHCVTYRTEILKMHNYVQTEGISYTDQQWVFAPIVWMKTAIYYNVPIYEYSVGREGQTVDIQVRKKNRWMYRKVFLDILKTYNHLCFSDAKDKWLKEKMLKKLHDIFYFDLLICPDTSSSLVEFDDELKKLNILFYQESSNRIVLNKIYPIRYLRIWRKTHCKLSHRIDVRIWSFICKIKSFL